MKKNIEIEFKTAVSEKVYQDLLEEFGLESNVFKQTNYYFDTDTLDLNKQQIVLRIRKKGNDYYKVTLKSQSDHGAYEYHVLLTPEQANEMLENGFNTKDFFDHVDYFVTFKTSLDNLRARTPYEVGTLFFDRCDYCGITEYEIEYEVDNFEEGKVAFNQFLENHQIEFKPTRRKSDRALTCIVK
ncbi:Adenylate cyclase [Alteracholeplasma palmae J233]|uniref:Adenylate cyclase n=1 Tax=Alteracholeplasma palmae (strain ATCC 49389 / J233) TaxID=1318466 RepID=U4KK11_ALTPJ|nr:CYTH domain-containing protein [Alteracholeplasma palmae]CCV63842.1 Adenylate cyclase [Alteracholeplasma palmae J233]